MNIDSHAESMARTIPAALNNSGDADATRATTVLDSKNEPARAKAIWGEAHALKQSLGTYDNVQALENEWAVLRGAGRESVAAANAAKAHYLAVIARNEEHAKLRAAALAESQAAARAIINAIPARTQWANWNLRPLWQLGEDLAALAAKVKATKPTDMVMNMPSTATAPIGNAAEAIAALDILEANLNGLTAAVAKARANLKAAS